MGGWVAENWRLAVVPVMVGIDLWAAAHAVLHKRETRAAVAWVGFIWLVPVVGAVLYTLLGINRIQRRARSLRGPPTPAPLLDSTAPCPALPLKELDQAGPALAGLARLVGLLTRRPLLAGNRVESLVDGDEAYPAMLGAIRDASRSVSLSTYLFDNDRVGRMFLEALAGALSRGVQVRVLVDDVGARYSWPSIVRPLRRAGVSVGRFLPRLVPWSFRYANLRDHRKILVVDGRIGFTGGINIREGDWLKLQPHHPIRDLHFRIEGPVVAHLQEVFADDWAFCTGEVLQGEDWFPPLRPAGRTLARGIADGPDEDFETLRLALLGALACAQSSVRIATPYFLPDAALITALNVAALRGVEVDIVLPEQSNLRLVQWASAAQLWQVLEHGCRVWLTPPPFDHTKLLVVDGAWSLVGSANWDPRSLRLNFEFDLECYDPELASALDALLATRIRSARPVNLGDMDGRRLPVKLRDGLARLLSPYL